MSGHRVERRRAARAPADFPIQLQNRGESREGRIKDLSVNGLCCAYPDPIDEMTLVGIGLALPGDDRLHSIKGAVVRCIKLRGQSPPTYEIAVYFTEVEPESRRALARFVEAHAPRPGEHATGPLSTP